MDSYIAFKTEVADIGNTWQLFAPFKYYKEYKQIYLRKIHRIRLACGVLHKFRTYKKPILEAIEIIPDENLLDESLETINTISTYPEQLFSLKIK